MKMITEFGLVETGDVVLYPTHYKQRFFKKEMVYEPCRVAFAGKYEVGHRDEAKVTLENTTTGDVFTETRNDFITFAKEPSNV